MALLPAAVRGDLLLLILSLDFIDFHRDRPKRLRAGTSGCNCTRPMSIYIEPHFHNDFFLYKIFEKYQSNKSRRHNLISRLRFCKINPLKLPQTARVLQQAQPSLFISRATRCDNVVSADNNRPYYY